MVGSLYIFIARQYAMRPVYAKHVLLYYSNSVCVIVIVTLNDLGRRDARGQIFFRRIFVIYDRTV